MSFQRSTSLPTHITSCSSCSVKHKCCPVCAVYLVDSPRRRISTSINMHRDTFAFDRVLYKDDCLEVTPSLLFLSRKHTPRFIPRIIDVAAVSEVRELHPGEMVVTTSPWFRRIRRGDSRILARSSRKRHNIVLDVQHRYAQKRFSVAFHSDDPIAVAKAVYEAKVIVYHNL